MTYFKNVNSLEELRKQYKDLLKKYHPDTPNGSEESTKAINNEYESLFKQLKNSQFKNAQNGSDGKQSTYNQNKYDFSEDEKLRNILNKVINFTNVTIEIIGQWIWISGNTYPYRKQLKEFGFKFGCQKKAWYWHSDTFRKKSNKKLSMNDIRNYYGSTEVQTEQQSLLQA